MRKLKRFTKTMSITLGVCLLLFAVTLYAVSSGLARAALQRLAENEANQGVQDGLRLLDRYGMDSEALEKAVNPELNPSEVFLVLLDTEGNVLAAAERAAKKREASDAMTDQISAQIGDELITVDEIVIALNSEEVTRNRVTARLGKLVKAGTIVKEAVKVEGNKRMAYRLATNADAADADEE